MRNGSIMLNYCVLIVDIGKSSSVTLNNHVRTFSQLQMPGANSVVVLIYDKTKERAVWSIQVTVTGIQFSSRCRS